MQKIIKINDTIYVRADQVQTSGTPTKKQIVVLQRGWVVVGNVQKTDSEVRITDCSVIRVWGTTHGLGELAQKGPLKDTKLDPCPPVTVHPLSVVFFMDVAEEAWL